MSQLTDFYSGEGPDGAGRNIEEILSWGPDRLESVHNYIQWLFPLDEPSNFNPNAPILTQEDVEVFRSNPIYVDNVIRAFKAYITFMELQLTEDNIVEKAEDFDTVFKVLWAVPNHNWMRVTRVD